MNGKFDVAIVGAGPAGISAACILAEKGVSTVVLERGPYPGSKNMFGGVLYGRDLAGIIPDFVARGCPIERNIVESRIWYLSQDSGYSVSYRDSAFSDRLQYNVFTVGRARFDRWYADQAFRKGALVVPATVVTDLLRDSSGRVVGVSTDRPGGELYARVVILADGVNSPLAAKTGFRPEVKPENVALAVKEVIALPEEVIDQRFNVEPGQGITTEILGATTMGMNGVAFIYTNKNSVSVGIGANLADFSKAGIKPYEMLEKFKTHPMTAPLIREGTPREYLAHWIPEGGYYTIPKLAGDGFLIAGDSAMLFNALHREGSNLAMTSGKLAALTVLDCMEKGDFSYRALSGYADRLEASFVMQDLRKYRNFPGFLHTHKELFSTVPELARFAAREMLTVDNVSKKKKQRVIWKEIRRSMTLMGMLRLVWDAWRSIR